MRLSYLSPTSERKSTLGSGVVIGGLWLFTAPKQRFSQHYNEEILSELDFRSNASLETHTE